MKIDSKILKQTLANAGFKEHSIKNLDSVEIITLVSILEKKFKINLKGEDIKLSNFSNLKKITQLIIKYKK